ncbi:MAG: class I SAM-dependent methyltransferase [Candidatus Omnitrophota bacterium]
MSKASSPRAVNFFEGICDIKIIKENDRKRTDLRKNISLEQKKLLETFEYEYFDSDLGYGGYFWDGRFAPAAQRMADYYGLGKSSRALDVGCAKGFLVYEFQHLLAGETNAFGCDISAYALKNGHPEIRPQLIRASAHQIGFLDRSFDLVVSVDAIHNLPEELCDQSLREMMRVSRRKIFLQVASYHTPAEKEALCCWGAALKTLRSAEQWLEAFAKIGYTGEYWFKTFAFAR